MSLKSCVLTLLTYCNTLVCMTYSDHRMIYTMHIGCTFFYAGSFYGILDLLDLFYVLQSSLKTKLDRIGVRDLAHIYLI